MATRQFALAQTTCSNHAALVHLLPGIDTNTSVQQVVVHEDAAPLSEEKEREKMRVLTRASLSFRVTGALSIVLSVCDFTVGVLAQVFMFSAGEANTIWFEGFLGGLCFGLVNGVLALRAAKRKQHVNEHLTNVIFAFGIAAMFIYCLDLSIALNSAIRYAEYLNYEAYGNYSYLYDHKSRSNAEAARSATVLLLLAVGICQVVTAANLLRYFRSRPLTFSFLTDDSARETGSGQPSQACQFAHASATNTAYQQEQNPMYV